MNEMTSETRPTVTGVICAECIAQDEDPLPWCDCVDDERCKGPCRKRAHDPVRCPFRTAYVPHPVPWRAVKVGDVIQTNDGQPGYGGLLQVTAVDEYGALTLSNGRVLAMPNGAPDYPVPVLVPYAERAAELVLRENDRQRGHASAVIERGTP